jgi:hypothetical protein
MSAIKNPKTDLLWVGPLETAGFEFDDCIRRGAGRLGALRGDPADDDDAVEWLVIEGLIRAWQAPRDS